MKKILILISIFISTSLIAAYSGGWNYYYHVSEQVCKKASETGVTVNYLIDEGCHIHSVSERDGTVMVLNCNDHPEIGGYVWFGRTLAACNWIKANSP